MEKTYKWDVEEMKHCVLNLKTECQTLTGCKSQIETLESDIAQAWQSIAGTAYEDVLEIDKDLLTQIIESVNEQIKKLNKVAKKDYQSCEDTVKQEAHTLASKIKAL